jgi:hypothetical protein
MVSISNLRLVWFASEITGGDANRLFASFCGQQPDRTSTSRQPSVHQPAIEIAAGIWNDYETEVQVQHGRIDVLFQPIPADAAIGSQEPHMVDGTTALVQVLSAINASSWLPIANRISAIITAYFPGPDVVAAREKFNNFLKIDLGIPEASDHFFQVNRQTLLEDVLCNRVIQLAVVEFQNIQINTGINGITQSSAKASQALSLTLDFNTILRAEVFELNSQKKLFASLFSEMRRAFDVGNIKFLIDG